MRFAPFLVLVGHEQRLGQHIYTQCAHRILKLLVLNA